MSVRATRGRLEGPDMPVEYIAGVQILLYGMCWTLGAILVREARRVLQHWAVYAFLQAASTLLATRALEAGEYPPLAALACSLVGFAVAARGVDVFLPPRPGLGRVLLGGTAAGLAAMLASLAWAGDRPMSEHVRALGYDLAVAAIEFGTAWPLWRRLRAAHGRTVTAVVLTPALLVACIAVISVMLQLSLGPHALGRAREAARVPNVIASLVFSAIFNFGYLFLLMSRLLGQLRHSAHHDHLTGCLNRRAAEARMEALWQQHRRSGARWCVALIDIDRFKDINDRLGHATGDAVLVTVAGVLREHTRAYDEIGRWGGEEFLLVMPETAAATARAVADRLRTRLAEASAARFGAPVTASAGIAEMRPGSDETVSGLVARADRAMYRAKQQGRNGTVVDDGDAGPAADRVESIEVGPPARDASVPDPLSS